MQLQNNKIYNILHRTNKTVQINDVLQIRKNKDLFIFIYSILFHKKIKLFCFQSNYKKSHK